MKIECVYAGPGVLERRLVHADTGATVADAVSRSGLGEWLEEHGHPLAGYAVFGRRVDAGEVLADGDRVELLRPLLTPPREARRKRARAAARR